MRLPFLSLLLVLAAHVSAADWPEFMGPTRDQVSVETGLTDTLPVQGPPLVFERAVGKGYSAPSIRSETMVIHHRVAGQEVVEACDARTGLALWKHWYKSDYRDPFGFNNGPRCTPLLTADVGCRPWARSGALLCLDLTTGKEVWRRNTQTDFAVPEAFFGVGSSPVLDDGLIFVQVGGQPNSGVVAFDANTGKTVWENVGEKTWNGAPMNGWPGERTVMWSINDPAYSMDSRLLHAGAGDDPWPAALTRGYAAGARVARSQDGQGEFLLLVSRASGSIGECDDPGGAGRSRADFVGLLSHRFRALARGPGKESGHSPWSGLQLEIHWTRPVLLDGYLYSFQRTQ